MVLIASAWSKGCGHQCFLCTTVNDTWWELKKQNKLPLISWRPRRILLCCSLMWSTANTSVLFHHLYEPNEKVHVYVGAWVHICLCIICMRCILFRCCVITLASLFCPLGGDSETILCSDVQKHGTKCTEHSVQMHILCIIYMHMCHSVNRPVQSHLRDQQLLTPLWGAPALPLKLY